MHALSPWYSFVAVIQKNHVMNNLWKYALCFLLIIFTLGFYACKNGKYDDGTNFPENNNNNQKNLYNNQDTTMNQPMDTMHKPEQ